MSPAKVAKKTTRIDGDSRYYSNTGALSITAKGRRWLKENKVDITKPIKLSHDTKTGQLIIKFDDSGDLKFTIGNGGFVLFIKMRIKNMTTFNISFQGKNKLSLTPVVESVS